MKDLLEVSVQSLLTTVLIFGFVPGFVLRLLVRIYPKDDPRRVELVAELYTIPRLLRPLFVAEQLETVLFEGIPHRARAVASTLRRRHWALLVADVGVVVGVAGITLMALSTVSVWITSILALASILSELTGVLYLALKRHRSGMEK